MDLPFPLSPILAIAITTVVGTLVSLPAVRIRGIQLAIVTVAAATAIEEVLFRSPSFTGLGGMAQRAQALVPRPEPRHPPRRRRRVPQPRLRLLRPPRRRGQRHAGGERPAVGRRPADAGRAGQRAGRRRRRHPRPPHQAARRGAGLVPRQRGRRDDGLQVRRLLQRRLRGVAGAGRGRPGLHRRHRHRGRGVRGRHPRARRHPVHGHGRQLDRRRSCCCRASA